MSLLNTTTMASRPACQCSHRVCQRTSYLYNKVRCKRQFRSGRSCQRANAAENPDMDAAMQQAMQDPKVRVTSRACLNCGELPAQQLLDVIVKCNCSQFSLTAEGESQLSFWLADEGADGGI